VHGGGWESFSTCVGGIAELILLGGLFSLFTVQIIVGSEIKSQEVVIVEIERFLLALEVLVMVIFVKFLGEMLAFLHLILGGEEF